MYTIIGVAGFAFYILGYGLVQLRRLDGNGLIYSISNLFGASLVLVSLYDQFNLASALTQITWIAAGIVGIVIRVVQRRGVQGEDAARVEVSS